MGIDLQIVTRFSKPMKYINTQKRKQYCFEKVITEL